MTDQLVTDDPNAAENNDKHIKDGLQKQKDGKGHWKPELASDSEEAVRIFPYDRRLKITDWNCDIGNSRSS